MHIIKIGLFIAIFIGIYGLINFYIYNKLTYLFISDSSNIKVVFMIIFIFISLAYFASRIIEKFYITKMTNSLYWVGSVWFGYMVYLLLAFLSFDLILFLNNHLHFIPFDISSIKIHNIYTIFTIITVTIVLYFGYKNATNPIITKLNLKIEKSANNLENLKIVMISDIHLGNIVKNSRLSHLVEMLKKNNPDIVLLPGDVLDEDIEPVIKYNLGEILRTIPSKYGVYAVSGNHEYIGGIKKATKYLTDHNIIMLRDSVVKIADSFYIIGREDVSRYSFTGKKRKDLDLMLKQVNDDLPVILLDHQPFGLKNIAEKNIDLMLSGHTHKGQIWPFRSITQMIFELDYGYKKIKNTNFYVSSGFGTWGPPVRIGNKPEIVEINLEFNKNNKRK